jgi:hypothetical protein
MDFYFLTSKFKKVFFEKKKNAGLPSVVPYCTRCVLECQTKRWLSWQWGAKPLAG